MARSNNYDFTKADVEEMFAAMQETLNNAKEEYYKKFEIKAKSERKSFVFGQSATLAKENIISTPAQSTTTNNEINSIENVPDVMENVEANKEEII